MTAGFMVPIYRFSDGWTWCRVGRAAFSGESSPRDDRLRRSIQMLSYQDDIKLFLFSHASRPTQNPLFFLLDPNFKIMEAFDCSPNRMFDCSTLQLPPYYEERPMFRYLALLEGLGVPFEDLQGPLPDGLEAFEVPYWVDDGTWKALETNFSNSMTPFWEHRDMDLEVVKSVNRILGSDVAFPYSSGFSRLVLGRHFEVLFSVDPNTDILLHQGGPDEGRAFSSEFSILRLADYEPLGRGSGLFVALQGLKTYDGEPMLLPFSEFEAWWAAKVEPVESVFDLSMFKLLGVRTPYLLPDDEFIAWVEALGGSPEVP